MKTLLSTTALMLCAAISCAQAAEKMTGILILAPCTKLKTLKATAKIWMALPNRQFILMRQTAHGESRWPIIRKDRLIIAQENAALV